MNIKKVFGLLESNLTGKRVANAKLQHNETTFAVVSSPNFVDPYEGHAKLEVNDNAK